MPSRRFILLFFVASFWLICGGKADDLDDLSPNISSVASGGEWQTGQDRGTFRLIVRTTDVAQADGSSHTIDRAYLQWIRVGIDSPIAKVIRTVPIPEVTRDLCRIGSNPTIGEGADKVCYVWMTLLQWEGPEMIVKITPKGDFTYAFSEHPRHQ